ncbi:hypothetical protein BV898_08383 [Hypsibius exemplaris]|uniref:UPAR/Ly6 domain-containing protein n=1 Tax=Hypsibius exemplaris TaxID=2072580 RepID=A0A1W0WQG5_HYPEX|nr:hypothetical protein BV898_08383 [Hypsibius exemplaris]
MMTPYGLLVMNGSAIALSLFLGLFLRLANGKDARADVTTTTANSASQILQCYQCHDQANNSLCSRPSDLMACKTSYRSNVCSTKVTRSPENGIRISKSCDTGPCNLGNMEALALGFDKLCDRTQPKWTCSSCCTSDGCNINLGGRMSAATTTMAALLGISLLRFL